MVYSSRLRKGIGELRAALESAGLGLQDARFARHGEHAPDVDAPLIMVSCSGGRDSMALAAVAAKTCASLGLRCGAIIIDHQLQQGSAGVARATADRCVALGLDPVRVRAIDVPDSRGIGVEAAAREARYHAIVDACSDASAVLLAHTKNDQAETVIIGLLRSAGLDAVCGMNGSFIRDGVRFLRPWLNVTREETTGICEDLRLAWWDDPTNGPDVGVSLFPRTIRCDPESGTISCHILHRSREATSCRNLRLERGLPKTIAHILTMWRNACASKA